MKSRSLVPWVESLAPAAGAVALTAPANPHYQQDTIKDDLHTACRDFAISADGVFSALCIKRTSLAPVERTIDLDGHIGNRLQANTLRWGGTNVSEKCNSLTVTVHSTGVDFSSQCWRDSQAVGRARAGQDGSHWRARKVLNLNEGIKLDSKDEGRLKRCQKMGWMSPRDEELPRHIY